MTGVYLFVIAAFSAIPLNIMARALGNEKAKWEGGKSIITMFICYCIGGAFYFLYAIPNKLIVNPIFGLLGWLLVLYLVILAIIGMGFKKTAIIAVAMAALTGLPVALLTSLATALG